MQEILALLGQEVEDAAEGEESSMMRENVTDNTGRDI
jgi:hypothetical protein